jgi:hypothetical protein
MEHLGGSELKAQAGTCFTCAPRGTNGHQGHFFERAFRLQCLLPTGRIADTRWSLLGLATTSAITD